MVIRISHGARSEDAIYNAELPDGTQHPLVILGQHSYGHEFFVHWEGEACQIEIGRYTSIAHGVRFFAGQEHHTEWGTTYPFTHLPPEWPEHRALTGHPVSRGNIVVGSDVWIGYGALIRSGVSIGHGAVIGMGAVVTHDVPPYAIVAGNPARTVRSRFDPEIVERLLELAWWDLPAEMVREIAPKLSQPLNSLVLKELEENLNKKQNQETFAAIESEASSASVQIPSQAEVNGLLNSYQIGDYKTTKKLAVSLTQRYPKHQFSWKVLAAALLQLGEKSESLMANQNAVNLDSTDAEAHSNLGIILHELGRSEDAAVSYKKAIALNPRAPEVYGYLGIALHNMRRLEDAAEAFEKALSLKHDSAEVHAYLGKSLQELGNIEGALRCYSEALNLKPDFPECFWNLSVLLRLSNKLKDSEDILRKLHAMDPDVYGLKAAVDLAIIKYLAGDLVACKELLLASVNILSKDEDILFKNSVIYWKYLYQLLIWHEKSGLIDFCASLNKVCYVIGDSHSLASHGLVVEAPIGHVSCRSFLIVGCKQWHLGSAARNKYKYSFENYINSIPSSSDVLLAIGEIDCRLDDGILKHIRDHTEKTKSDVIDQTVNDYLKYVSKVTAGRLRSLTIQGIPCPNVNKSKYDRHQLDELVSLIQEFNNVLRTLTAEMGFGFLDVGALTENGDGFSNGKWHIDFYHLSPGGMQEAWRSHLINN